MPHLKNLIFDLGGVLLNINYHNTANAFRALGVHQFDDLYSQASANKTFEALETGTITEEDFYSYIKQYCRPYTTKQELQKAWNEILLDFRMDSLELLNALSSNYRLYLLSNTNSIHLSKINEILLEQTGRQTLDDYFVRSYYSHQIHLRKPYPDTYKWVLENAGIIAEETLFIDDSIKNIEGARLAGLQTHLLLSDETIADLKL